MARILLWLAVVASVVVADEVQVPPNITDSREADDPVPVHSMHRLIPSVIDNVSLALNSSEPITPSNITLDTSPFLPSGVPTYRNAPLLPPNNVSNSSLQPKNFTPSYFIGEVIPEPYIPERLQTSRSSEDGKHSSSQSQKLVPSQTTFAIHKILPFLEHMKHAVGHSFIPGHGHEGHEYVPPVHEPSHEEDDTPHYVPNYEDQHADRPSYFPHHHESPNLHSTKPITFDNGGQHLQQDSPGYHPQDIRGNIRYPYAHHGKQEYFNHHYDHFSFNGTSGQPKNHPEHFSGGPYFAHDYKDHQKEHLDHFSHHDYKQKENTNHFGHHDHQQKYHLDHFTHHDHQQNDHLDHFNHHDHQQKDHLDHFSHHDHQQKDHLDHLSHHDHQQKDHLDHFNHHDHQQKDHLDHFSHHGADFVLPSPFYPPEPEYTSSHQKDIHYKVYQNKAKSPLHGLLHFAAALIPLGLFVAALQPSVIHVNSSQTMPAKYRSGDDATSGQDVLGMPGLEVLERLGLGNIDGADCERRAFCELAVLGGRPEGNTAQRGLWKLANSIPMQYASTLGLEQVLKAVKADSCSSLKCVDPKLRTETGPPS